MKKVKLTKIQTDLLDDKLNHYKMKPHDIIKGYVDMTHPNNQVSSVFVNHFPDLDVLIRALYIGYEVELTPEEQLLQYYLGVINSNESEDGDYEIAWNSGFMRGVNSTLDILDIKIKGINSK